MRRALRLTLASITIAGLVTVLWTGHHLTQPARTATGEPGPGLEARPLSFASENGARLSAWFVPGASGGGAVLLLHAVRANKQSMLPRARFLNALGFSVLLVDLQAHGESEGERITFGLREAADARAAVVKLAALAPGERIGVVGVSLGAAALLLADVRPAPSAAVIESLYPAIDAAVSNRLQMRLGTVGTWLAPLLLAQLPLWVGAGADQLRPIDRIAGVRYPILLVHGSEDRHTTLDEAHRLYGAAPQPKALYVISGAAHVDLHAFAGPAYEQRVGAFLARHLRHETRD